MAPPLGILEKGSTLSETLFTVNKLTVKRKPFKPNCISDYSFIKVLRPTLGLSEVTAVCYLSLHGETAV